MGSKDNNCLKLMHGFVKIWQSSGLKLAMLRSIFLFLLVFSIQLNGNAFSTGFVCQKLFQDTSPSLSSMKVIDFRSGASAPAALHAGNSGDYFNSLKPLSQVRLTRSLLVKGKYLLLGDEKIPVLIDFVRPDLRFFMVRNWGGHKRYFLVRNNGIRLEKGSITDFYYDEVTPKEAEDLLRNGSDSQSKGPSIEESSQRTFSLGDLNFRALLEQLVNEQFQASDYGDIRSLLSNLKRTQEEITEFRNNLNEANQRMLSWLNPIHEYTTSEIPLNEIQELSKILNKSIPVQVKIAENIMTDPGILPGLIRGSSDNLVYYSTQNYRVNLTGAEVALKVEDGAEGPGIPLVRSSEVNREMQTFLRNLNSINTRTGLRQILEYYKLFIEIHPFLEGYKMGPLARILLDYMLMKAGFQPALHTSPISDIRDVLYYTKDELYVSFVMNLLQYN